jgi:phage terminase large subunit-like protein
MPFGSLRGHSRDDRLFALIYTIDPEDDPWIEASWVKANPSWGQAVQPDAGRAIMRQARNNAVQEAAAKTRHLNMWVGADEALFSLRSWQEAADTSLSIDDFEGHECHLGLDLASRTDLAAMALVFPERDPDTGRSLYKVFARCYLNETAVAEARNPSYPGWAATGSLVVTPGNETDFDVIEADIRELSSRFQVVSVGYDPWQSAQMSQRLRSDGLPMFEFRATTQNFSPAIIEMDAAMRACRLRHDGNPVLEWCMGNVVGKADRRGNLYPTKTRPDQKIDAAVALMMAIGRVMTEDENARNLGSFLTDLISI